jgi:hypothetical protein
MLEKNTRILDNISFIWIKLIDIFQINVPTIGKRAVPITVGNVLSAKKSKIAKEITKSCFEIRVGNRPYHGRIKNVAEGARTTGLIFFKQVLLYFRMFGLPDSRSFEM